MEKAVEWLEGADSILVAAGAGLSASAGLDYTSEAVLRTYFPVMHAMGFRCFYEFFGYRDWSPALQWGYLLSQVNLARYQWPPSSVYAKLRTLAESVGSEDGDSNHFVITTNADGMFGRNGFDLDHVFTPQGDYSRMQCLGPCSPDAVWPMQEFLDAGLPYVDPATQEITRADSIPKCRLCGGPVMMNVRGGNWFLEWPHAEQKRKYKQWLQTHVSRAAERGRYVVIIEIGVGFNTPGVVRFPMEGLATQHGDVCKLVRINAAYADVPPQIDGTSAVGIALDAEAALDALLAARHLS
eukprot:gnl/Spiro4/4470_TR2230_c0_g1_i1.p1 gnl/Spiro4/4470_TR2230_c0_g1~~gnl/Spiro4/4470_TR2230_c0_g1_i1.p1  ORF type:complete len:297 (+),score=88.36 gnl/Spiro4/4470_TR2230_c0_g1_i1:55-945(+)